jgi:hypothetical protein
MEFIFKLFSMDPSSGLHPTTTRSTCSCSQHESGLSSISLLSGEDHLSGGSTPSCSHHDPRLSSTPPPPGEDHPSGGAALEHCAAIPWAQSGGQPRDSLSTMTNSFVVLGPTNMDDDNSNSGELLLTPNDNQTPSSVATAPPLDNATGNNDQAFLGDAMAPSLDNATPSLLNDDLLPTNDAKVLALLKALNTKYESRLSNIDGKYCEAVQAIFTHKHQNLDATKNCLSPQLWSRFNPNSGILRQTFPLWWTPFGPNLTSLSLS